MIAKMNVLCLCFKSICGVYVTTLFFTNKINTTSDLKSKRIEKRERGGSDRKLKSGQKESRGQGLE